jgi:hypothetical protein
VRRDMPPADPRTNPCSAFRTAFIGNDGAPEKGKSGGAGIAVGTEGSGCSACIASFCAASDSETTAAALWLATAREK